MHRTLKPGGKIIVTAPASFGVVFTNAAGARSAEQHIADVLNAIPPYPTPDQIVEGLSHLQEVLRATFVVKDGRLTLIAKESDLVDGEAIWRKIPGLVVPSHYHPEIRYVEAALGAGLTIDRVDRPVGTHEELCTAYETHPAFIVMHLSKR